MTRDYFATLNLPVSFDLDLAQLERHYFEAQRLFHPDRLVGKTAVERTAALQRSMEANEAFATLKDPHKRARHMLAQKGIEVGGERDSVKPDQALLLEIMELREAVADADSPEAVEHCRRKTQESKKNTLRSLADAFTREDLPEAAQLVMRLGYVMKIEEEMKGTRF